MFLGFTIRNRLDSLKLVILYYITFFECFPELRTAKSPQQHGCCGLLFDPSELLLVTAFKAVYAATRIH